MKIISIQGQIFQKLIPSAKIVISQGQIQKYLNEAPGYSNTVAGVCGNCFDKILGVERQNISKVLGA